MQQEQLIQQPVIKEHTAKNFAPLSPLLAIARGNTKATSTLGEAIRERFKHHYNLEKRIREGMIASGYQVAMFIEGKQLIRPNLFAPGQWIPYRPQNPNEREKRAMNFCRFYTTNNLWKWQLSNPDVVATPGVDTQQAREGAQAADTIIEHYERKFFADKPQLVIQEGFQGLCWGTYVWGVRYDDTQHSVTALQPIFGMKPVTLGEGWGQCGSCSFSGPASQFQSQLVDPLGGAIQTCPQCGGEAMVDQPATELMPSVVGQQEVSLGDLTAELKPFPECAWDYRTTVEESSWFIHQRATSALAVRRLLGNIKLPTGGEGIDDFGLQIMSKLGYASAGSSGQAQQDERKREIFEDPATVVEYSVGPDDIADIVLSAPIETVGGDVIPAGPLLQFMPEGGTFQGINGLTVITGVFPGEHHSASHKSGVWYSKPSSGTGQGLEDMVEVQKRYNSIDSQILTFLRASSTPAMRAVKEAIGEENRGQYLGDPNANILINAQNIPEGMSPEQIVGPVFQPQSVPAQFFGYAYQNLNNMAQIVTHITDFSGGLPGVKNNTATGAQITQSNSNALFTPPLQVKGEVRLAIAKITVALYRKHFPVNRPFALKGRYGRQQFKHLSAANLPNDIQFEVVRDSELPKNMFTKREDFFTMFQMLGGAPGYVQLRATDPELCVEIQRIFNAKLESEPYDQIASLCQQRITQIQQVAELAPDPTLLTGLTIEPVMQQVIQIGPGVIDPPIAMEEPAHNLKAKWLSEWLDEDQGQEAGPVLRGCVILLVRYHFQLFGLQQGAMAFQQGAIQTAGGAPAAIGGTAATAFHNEVNPVPDVNNDKTNPNEATATTGRPRPKAK